MDNLCRAPILILEGPGDVAAVPLLIRRILHEAHIFDLKIMPRPKTNVEAKKLIRSGELERYMDYCNREAGDSIILAIDSDKQCPVSLAKDFSERVINCRLNKPVLIIFFVCEFESLFLPSLDIISARYPEFRWKSIEINSLKFEEIVSVKELISSLMPKDKAYKETRDQVKFAEIIDLQRTRDYIRSFRHFEDALMWLMRQPIGSCGVHPIFK